MIRGLLSEKMQALYDPENENLLKIHKEAAGITEAFFMNDVVVSPDLGVISVYSQVTRDEDLCIAIATKLKSKPYRVWPKYTGPTEDHVKNLSIKEIADECKHNNSIFSIAFLQLGSDQNDK